MAVCSPKACDRIAEQVAHGPGVCSGIGRCRDLLSRGGEGRIPGGRAAFQLGMVEHHDAVELCQACQPLRLHGIDRNSAVRGRLSGRRRSAQAEEDTEGEQYAADVR